MADREGDVFIFGRLGRCLGIGQPRGGPSYKFGDFCVGQPPSYIFDEFGFGQPRGGRLQILTAWALTNREVGLGRCQDLTSWALANREGGVSTF